MANVQPQFEQFHEAIKLKRFEENKILREKRDIVLDKLRAKLPGVFAAYNEEYPQPVFRDQGSYEMGTGIKPLKGDYDIDQGVYFPVGTADYPDPVVLKKRVHEALDGHTKSVTIRRSCVSVTYQRDGEDLYHVDLAIYADGSQEDDGKARLAKGKENSGEEYRYWEISNPKGLTNAIVARFQGYDRYQFRRIVRYLKRWRSVNFSADGHAAPLGIGLTVAAYLYLQTEITDRVSGKADDLTALRRLVDSILGAFVMQWDPDEQKFVSRLSIVLPVEPHGDLFVQMTNVQMADFEGRLKALKIALDAAASAVDPVEASKCLQKLFGKDFPVPDPEETAKKHAPAIVSSSSSA